MKRWDLAAIVVGAAMLTAANLPWALRVPLIALLGVMLEIRTMKTEAAEADTQP